MEKNSIYISRHRHWMPTATHDAGCDAAKEENREILKELRRREKVMEDMKFIIWDPKDGYPRRAEDGSFISDGIIGRVNINNVYLTTYASYPDGAKKLADLEVGEVVRCTRFSLSGERGTYDIYRVK